LGFELRRLQEHRRRQSRQLSPIPLNLAPDQVEESTIAPIDIDAMRAVIRNCHSGVGSPMASALVTPTC
jgi:hypothetical protein